MNLQGDLADMKREATKAREDRERLQLHHNELTVAKLALQRELEDAKALVERSKETESAKERQVTLLVEEKTTAQEIIETLRRQLQASETVTREAQALVRTGQQQNQTTMLPPNSLNGQSMMNPGTPLARTENIPMTTKWFHSPWPFLLPCGFPT